MIGRDFHLTAPDGHTVSVQSDVGVGRMSRAEAIARDVLEKHPTATRLHVVSYAVRDQEYATVFTPTAPGFRVRVTI